MRTIYHNIINIVLFLKPLTISNPKTIFFNFDEKELKIQVKKEMGKIKIVGLFYY